MDSKGLLSLLNLNCKICFCRFIIKVVYWLILCNYIIVITLIKPEYAPANDQIRTTDAATPTGGIILSVILSLLPPAILILTVLGSIFFGIATPSEAAGVGALGAMVLAGFHRKLDLHSLKEACHATAKMSAFVFLLIYGAPCFALVLRGLGGDEVIEGFLRAIAGGKISFVLFALTIVFVLGFFLDWIEITVIMIPLILPIVTEMQIDTYWFAILVAVCLQTSFLTPPMGPALFYVQGVSPSSIRIENIYRGIIPYVILQLMALIVLLMFPSLVTWLPSVLGSHP